MCSLFCPPSTTSTVLSSSSPVPPAPTWAALIWAATTWGWEIRPLHRQRPHRANQLLINSLYMPSARPPPPPCPPPSCMPPHERAWDDALQITTRTKTTAVALLSSWFLHPQTLSRSAPGWNSRCSLLAPARRGNIWQFFLAWINARVVDPMMPVIWGSLGSLLGSDWTLFCSVKAI
jgi:hypothetical protein